MPYNRAPVTRRLKDIATIVLPEVTVTYGWPGPDITDSGMWFGRPEGLSSPESIGSANKLTKDIFTIPVAMSRAGFLTPEDAAEGIEEWVRLFDATLRSLTRLKDPSGVIPDDTDALHRAVVSAHVGQMTGPGWNLPNPTSGASIVGGVAFEIDCVTSLS